MKALVFDKFGPAQKVLKLKDIEEPKPGPGQVKVKIHYSPINPSDLYNTIEGTYATALARAIWNYQKPYEEITVEPAGIRKMPVLPHIPGLEGVGTVVESGSGLLAKRLRGKRVLCLATNKGNWQEYNIINARMALPLHRGVSDEQAAMAFVNPVTCLAMVDHVLKIGKGDTLLQSAANSELGKMIIRLAKKRGYKTINIIRNEKQRDTLKQLGADYVINIKKEDLRQVVYGITSGQGVKYAIDPIAGGLGSEMVSCLGLHGRMLVYGTLSSQPLKFSARDLMTPLASVEGFFITNWLPGQSLLKRLSLVKKAGKLIHQGALSSRVAEVYSLNDYKKALAAAASTNNEGKILFKL